jgi:uncharacterized protein
VNAGTRSGDGGSEPTVTRDDSRGAYELGLDGRQVGGAYFRLEGGRAIFTHTEIDPDYEHRHLGSLLVGEALDDVRRRGETVVPLCPFVAAYIRDHDEYVDLLDRQSG